MLKLRFYSLIWVYLLALSKIQTYSKKCETSFGNVKLRPYIVNGEPSTGYSFVVGVGGFKKNQDNNMTERQIGGWKISGRSYWAPYVACTGVIIDHTWILTAGHCLIKLKSPFIIAGSPLALPTPKHHYFSLKNKFIHEEFNKTGVLEHDMALIQVKKALSTIKNTKRILLANQYVTYTFATIAGFGHVSRSSKIRSHILREVVVENQEWVCGTYYNRLFDITRQTCAGTLGKGVSDSDSGGPLFAILNHSFVLIGLVSFDDGDVDIKKPTVFTRVSAYLNWMQRKTENGCFVVSCQP